MRVSPIRGQLASAGAQFTERYGTEVAAVFSDNKTEYYHVRDNAGLTDFSYMQKFSALRKGLTYWIPWPRKMSQRSTLKVLHTFIPDDNGMILADCYIATMMMNCWCSVSITDDAKLRSIFTASPDVKSD